MFVISSWGVMWVIAMLRAFVFIAFVENAITIVELDSFVITGETLFSLLSIIISQSYVKFVSLTIHIEGVLFLYNSPVMYILSWSM